MSSEEKPTTAVADTGQAAGFERARTAATRAAVLREAWDKDDCPGFPEHCPSLRLVDPQPPRHYGGIRCGCADDGTAPPEEATAVKGPRS